MPIIVVALSGFAGGILLRSYVAFGWEVAALACLLAALFVAARLRKPRFGYMLAASFCAFFALGIMRVAAFDTPPPPAFASELRHRVSYDGIVTADPDVRDANQRILMRVTSGGESTNVLVVAPRYPKVGVGDTVRVSGTLLVPQPFVDNGRVFRYDKYLQREDVRFIISYASVRTLSRAPWYAPSALLARTKHAFLDGLALALPEPESALAGGIVIGGKASLGEELRDVFFRSGLAQIVVLSGYNVMVVAEWVMSAFAFAHVPRRWSTVLGASTVLVFVGVAGASATAVRAMLMAFIALYARASGRSYEAGRALLIVVFLMLMWNPLSLAFDPGFDLSVAATGGLIWLAPRIETLLSFMRNAFWKNALATTLAAQIAVLPLLLYATGNLSLVAIPANLLVMPLIPITMGLSALTGLLEIVLGSFAPLLGILIGFPAYIVTAVIIGIARVSAALPFASVPLPPFSFLFVLAAYVLLTYFAASKRFSTTLQLRFAKKASI